MGLTLQFSDFQKNLGRLWLRATLAKLHDPAGLVRPGMPGNIHPGRAAKLFSFDRVNKAGAKFDWDKLDWLNSQYLHAMEAEELLGSWWCLVLKGSRLSTGCYSRSGLATACSCLINSRSPSLI